MSDMVYMSKRDGKWERWRTGVSTAPVKTTGTAPAGGQRLTAQGIALCISLNIISQNAAMTVHFPGYLCPHIPGWAAPNAAPPPAAYQAQYNDIKAKVREMYNAHAAELSGAQIHIMNADSNRGGNPASRNLFCRMLWDLGLGLMGIGILMIHIITRHRERLRLILMQLRPRLPGALQWFIFNDQARRKRVDYLIQKDVLREITRSKIWN